MSDKTPEEKEAAYARDTVKWAMKNAKLKPHPQADDWAEKEAAKIECNDPLCVIDVSCEHYQRSIKAALLSADQRGFERGRKAFMSTVTNEQLLAEIESRLPEDRLTNGKGETV